VGRAARHAAAAVVAALFGLIAAIFAAGIFGRYVLNRPIIWADEVLVLALVWCTFLAGALVLREREQVVFDLAYGQASAQGKRAMVLAGSLLLIGILGAALPQLVDYTLFLWRERTNVLKLRLDWAYACFPLFIAAVIVRRLALVAALLGAGWQQALAAIEGDGEPR
jgi:TRAP-type C4-dicarboxylate transport system permease small subunit